MYTIELQHLTLHTAQNSVLGAIENICDSFHLEEQFGVISYAMHELLSVMECCSDNQDAEFSVNLYVENDRISTQVLDFKNMEEVSARIDRATMDDADTAAYTVGCLTDNHELRNNGAELWLDIMVTPTFDAVDRAGILHQQTVKSQNAMR